MGLEPTTSWATTRCPNQLGHAHHPKGVRLNFELYIPAHYEFCKDKVANTVYRASLQWEHFFACALTISKQCGHSCLKFAFRSCGIIWLHAISSSECLNV
jgi:hypothetical protein